MARPVVAGNWKMNTTPEEAQDLARGLKRGIEPFVGVERILCPPFVSLGIVAREVAGSGIKVGAQNVHQAASGAFTGEISVSMLRLSCSYVIVGHSERRQFSGETDAIVAAKVAAAITGGLRPIVCVGESLQVREAGRAEAHIAAQLKASLEKVPPPESLVIGYEPVWAIGTGMAATPDLAQSAAAAIRSTLLSIYGQDAAHRIPIVYGGSVNAGNIAGFVEQRDVDGALVGGASLKVDDFTRIVEAVSRAKAK
ncbi:MAG: triose-phosphate isomerase [SAR202 cluster bacterium]|nr:triose-phosphate isomerase [SAR202 cluster bacterium]